MLNIATLTYTLDYCILLKQFQKMNTISAQHVKMIYCYLVDHSQYKQIEDNKLTLLPIFVVSHMPAL